MTVYKAPNPSGTRPLAEVIGKLQPGDTLQLEPGVYEAAGEVLNGISLVGLAPKREDVVIRGQAKFTGRGFMKNLTFKPTNGESALHSYGQETELQLIQVTFEPVDSKQYSAFSFSGGKLNAQQSNFRCYADSRGIALFKGARAEFRGCGVIGFFAKESQASFIDSVLLNAFARDNSTLDLLSSVILKGSEGCYAAIVKQNSRINLVDVTLDGEGRNMLSEGQGSHIEAKFVKSQGGRTSVIYCQDGGTGQALSPQIKVETVQPKQAPQAAAAPQSSNVVLWRHADKDKFEEKVRPYLKAGVTVRFEKGRYEWPAEHNSIVADMHFEGAGHETVFFAQRMLVTQQGAHLSVSNMAMRTQPGHSMILIYGRTTLKNVNIESDPEGQSVAIGLRGGHLEAHELTVANADTCQKNDGTIKSQIRALEKSSVVLNGGYNGWIVAEEGSSLTMNSAKAHCVQLFSGATFTGNWHVVRNTANLRSLKLEGGASADLKEILLLDGYNEFMTRDSTLKVNVLRYQNGASAKVYDLGGSTFNVPDALGVVGPDSGNSGQPAQPNKPGQPAQPAPQEKTPEENTPKEKKPEQKPVGNPLEELEKMIGLASVKEEVRTIVSRVKYFEARKQQGFEVATPTLHSLFLGNPGTGKTTVARLLGTALFQAGAVRENKFVEVGRADLVSGYVGQTATKTQEVLDEALGGILFIDEAYTLYQDSNNDFGQEAMDTILAFMENHRDDIMIIFAGYRDEMQDFVGMNPGLKSRITNTFDFADYTTDEITSMGLAQLKDLDYSIDEAEYGKAIARKYSRTTDRSNGRWVRNFNQELMDNQMERLIRESGGALNTLDAAALGSITKEDIQRLLGGDAERKDARVDELLEELNSMSGLTSVKTWVTELVNTARANKRLVELGMPVSQPNYHAIFTGNPGTGKTTVARIIAGIFHNLDMLETSHVREVNRGDLVGAVIGETEKKTEKILDDAMGGVLFVDEAYTLAPPDNPRDFGPLAIDTMLPRLENDRDKFIAIFAGYTDDMERFLDANEGMRSRVPRVIEFPDYSAPDVAGIVAAILRKTWTFNEELVLELATAHYESLPENRKANARSARNMAEAIDTRHKIWIGSNDALSKDDIMHIQDETIRTAFSNLR